MDPADAARAVLREADGAELHWTVIWDRALRAGYLDPMADPDARARLQRALADDAKAGRIVKTSTGTYRSADVGSGDHAG